MDSLTAHLKGVHTYSFIKHLLIALELHGFWSWVVSVVGYALQFLSRLKLLGYLTGHFITFTLLVPGWNPGCFPIVLILNGIDLAKTFLSDFSPF